MAYRGRGRGRGGWGRGGGGFGFAKQDPFELWPEVELPDVNGVEESSLVGWNHKLLNYCRSSPYHLEETVSKQSKIIDIERYSDWGKAKTTAKRDSLYQFLQLRSNNFPKELVGDSRREQPNPKKVRWNQDADLQMLDLFEKREQKFEGREEKGEKEKKEGEDEDENEDDEKGSSEGEFSDDGDYNQNDDFDDDEDDFNMDDGNDDEAIY